MSHHDLVANVLAGLAASYSTPEEPIDPSLLPTPEENVIGRNLSKDQAKALVKGEEVAPIKDSQGEVKAPPTPGPITLPLPEKGSLGAEGFLKAMRGAGVRKGKLDPSAKREDETRAIAAYIGYNSNELHGAQEVAARMQAQRELRPISVNVNEVWRRSGSPMLSAAGYVAGVCDENAKRIENLKAQEVVAAESLCTHRNAFMNPYQNTEARATAQLLMKLEEERIEQIRKDLALLGEKM